MSGFRCDPPSEQAPIASGFKSPLTAERTPPAPPPQAPVPQAPSGVHVALGVTSPLSLSPAPCSVLQAPPSRGDSTACGSWGLLPRGSRPPAPRRPASVPCVPAGPAPSGHGGRAHLCEHEAGSPTEDTAASCTQEPRPHFHEQLGTQSTSGEPLSDLICAFLGGHSSLGCSIQ